METTLPPHTDTSPRDYNDPIFAMPHVERAWSDERGSYLVGRNSWEQRVVHGRGKAGETKTVFHDDGRSESVSRGS